MIVVCRSWTGQGKQRQPCSPRTTPRAPAGTPRTPPITCMSHHTGHMLPGSSATGTTTGIALALTLQLTPLVKGFKAALRVILGILFFCMCPCLGAFAMLVFGCDFHSTLHSFWKGALNPLESQSTPFLAFCFKPAYCPLAVLGILLHADFALCCLLTVKTVWAFCFVHVPFLRSASHSKD